MPNPPIYHLWANTPAPGAATELSLCGRHLPLRLFKGSLSEIEDCGGRACKGCKGSSEDPGVKAILAQALAKLDRHEGTTIQVETVRRWLTGQALAA
jgi:hypothetical protein